MLVGGLKKVSLICLSLGISSCIEPKEESPITGSDAGKRNFSCLNLVNGQIDSEDQYGPVVELKAGLAICTGTFVSDNTLITAAHCVNPTEPGGGIKAIIKGKTVLPLKALVPAVSEGVERQPKDDIAVVIFPEGTSDEAFAVGKIPPRVGQRITIVGYGQTDFVGNNLSDEKRRFGFNTITELLDGGSTIKYELPVGCNGKAIGTEAMAGRGDSGGPIFTTAGMIGIIVRGENKNGKLIEYDANLVTPLMEKFLLSTAQEGARINGLTTVAKEASTGNK